MTGHRARDFDAAVLRRNASMVERMRVEIREEFETRLPALIDAAATRVANVEQANLHGEVATPVRAREERRRTGFAGDHVEADDAEVAQLTLRGRLESGFRAVRDALPTVAELASAFDGCALEAGPAGPPPPVVLP